MYLVENAEILMDKKQIPKHIAEQPIKECHLAISMTIPLAIERKPRTFKPMSPY